MESRANAVHSPCPQWTRACMCVCVCVYVSNGVTHLAPNGHGPVKDAMHAQDGRLRGVDDGRVEHGSKHASVADGEGASVHVLHGQLVLTCLRGEGRRRVIRHRLNLNRAVVLYANTTKTNDSAYLLSQCIDGFLNVSKVHGLHAADDRHHQPLWQTKNKKRNRSQLLRKAALKTQIYTHMCSSTLPAKQQIFKGVKSNKIIYYFVTNDIRASKVQSYLWCCHGHTDVYIVPIHNFFGGVINNWWEKHWCVFNMLSFSTIKNNYDMVFFIYFFVCLFIYLLNYVFLRGGGSPPLTAGCSVRA